MIRDGFDLIYSMNLELPTRWLLLDKAIATLASVGVELYPEFNVFEVAKPYARNLMIGRYSPQRISGGRGASRSTSSASPARCRTRCTTCWSRSATGRSRSASCTRAWTTSS